MLHDVDELRFHDVVALSWLLKGRRRVAGSRQEQEWYRPPIDDSFDAWRHGWQPSREQSRFPRIATGRTS
jgi:hypothetical protein